MGKAAIYLTTYFTFLQFFILCECLPLRSVLFLDPYCNYCRNCRRLFGEIASRALCVFFLTVRYFLLPILNVLFLYSYICIILCIFFFRYLIFLCFFEKFWQCNAMKTQKRFLHFPINFCNEKESIVRTRGVVGLNREWPIQNHKLRIFWQCLYLKWCFDQKIHNLDSKISFDIYHLTFFCSLYYLSIQILSLRFTKTTSPYKHLYS